MGLFGWKLPGVVKGVAEARTSTRWAQWWKLPGVVKGVAELKTRRLRLVAMTPAMLEADVARDGTLGSVLGAKVTGEWPPADWETHVLEMIFVQAAEKPSSLGWHRYALLAEGRMKRTLVGCVGGFPKAEGVVEIGYSTLPSYQRRGLGSEAARALVDWLLEQEGVRAVTAQTMAGSAESIKVMERCGMRFVGGGDDAGTVRYWRER
jgi:[ribosomal protein S5]-alanine N-acetyltransferase